MAMLTHDFEPSFRPRQPPVRPAAATARLATVKRFGLYALGALLGGSAVAAIIALKTAAYFRAISSRRRLTAVMRRGMISSTSWRSVNNCAQTPN
jgi:hypothetical protein